MSPFTEVGRLIFDETTTTSIESRLTTTLTLTFPSIGLADARTCHAADSSQSEYLFG
jgi:hypothetical protein